MSAPYESDMVTTLFRLINEAIDQEHHIIVWACGSATAMTLDSIGESKPRNFSQLSLEYPSVTALVKTLLEKSEGRLQWFICRHCMEERGTLNQIPEVIVKPTFKYMQYYKKADVKFILGSK